MSTTNLTSAMFISQGNVPMTLPARRRVNFAEQFNLHLFPHVNLGTDIDAEARVVKARIISGNTTS